MTYIIITAEKNCDRNMLRNEISNITETAKLKIMDAVIYTKLILILFSSNFLDINNATPRNFQLEFPCAKFYKKGELRIDCSHKNLRYIPNLPSNTVYLNLQHNLIIQIPNNTFEHMTDLKVLDLSFNKLQSMNDQTFNGLGNLKHLKLNKNKLTGEMLNKSFKYMTCLTHLDLSFNMLQRINEQTFIGLQNLQNLQLNNNILYYSILNFPPGSFKPLESLTRLSFQKNNFKPKIIPDRTTVFPDKTISDFKMLEILELDINTGSGDKAIFGKGFSSLKNLYLLKASYCETFILESDTFQYTPNLTHVYFNHCSLKVYRKHDEFSKLMKLKVLQLNGWYHIIQIYMKMRHCLL
ncbi:unnamed protein product [Mytilus coruscus]|uniref:LRRNT domain-containing protein n=1 Tax=Mytilus coruscus TaxID=42192 RepID=A0A6J8CHP5_MYTCO|nr:unnamed protein product [Mytilus coruscus]